MRACSRQPNANQRQSTKDKWGNNQEWSPTIDNLSAPTITQQEKRSLPGHEVLLASRHCLVSGGMGGGGHMVKPCWLLCKVVCVGGYRVGNDRALVGGHRVSALLSFLRNLLHNFSPSLQLRDRMKSAIKTKGPAPAAPKHVTFDPEVLRFTLEHSFSSEDSTLHWMRDARAAELDNMEFTEAGGCILPDAPADSAADAPEPSDMQLTDITVEVQVAGGDTPTLCRTMPRTTAPPRPRTEPPATARTHGATMSSPVGLTRTTPHAPATQTPTPTALPPAPEPTATQTQTLDPTTMSFTGAAGDILEQSLSLTEVTGAVWRGTDPQQRVAELQELRSCLAARRAQLQQATALVQEMAAQTARQDQEACHKHHALGMLRRGVPLEVRALTNTHLMVLFNGWGSAVTFSFGRATGSAGPLLITDTQWAHDSQARATQIEQRGVDELLRTVVHTKQLRHALQLALGRCYAGEPASFWGEPEDPLNTE